MATSHAAFLHLPLQEQVSVARAEGTFLNWRWETQDIVTGLYHLPAGFFCELHFSLQEMTVLTLLTSTKPLHLNEYSADVELDELLGGFSADKE